MKINDIKQKVINTQSIVILFIVFLFIIAALFIYRRYITNRLNGTYVANNEYNKTNKTGIESVDIYFFYTEWCPHCKTAKPIWNDFKNSMENTKINGIKLLPKLFPVPYPPLVSLFIR